MYKCKKCGSEMAQSKAIAQTLTGMKDFPGDKHAVTLSNGGPGVLIDCLKCTNCGWSMTIPTSPEKIEIPPKVVDQEVEDKLFKKFNPSGFQWQDENGKVFKIEDLSRNDLLQIACSCMHTIEKAEELCLQQKTVFSAWHQDIPINS